jgi:hypothetical protein
VTQNAWGICVDFIQAYLYLHRALVEVEIIKPTNCRVRVYKRQFERFSGAYCFTYTHGMLVVVRHNMCEVPVWT